MPQPTTRGTHALNAAPPTLTPSIAVRCLCCGYDLAGLPTSGVCPECASPIERSLQGNLLRFASPEYIKTLRRGATIVFVASLLYVFDWIPILTIKVLLALADVNISGALDAFANMATLGTMLLGWWMLSSPDPAFVGHDDSRDWRVRLRWMLPFASLVILTHAILPHLFSAALATSVTIGIHPASFPLSFEEILRWVARVAHAVVIFAGLKYIHALALRIPSVKVRKEATDAAACIGIVILLLLLVIVFGIAGRFAGWLYVIVATLFLSAGVTFLIWLVTYFVLLGRLRHELSRVAIMADAHQNVSSLLTSAPRSLAETAQASTPADSIQPPPITQSGSESS